MGYYIGTFEDCEAYDRKVTREERYTGDVTSRWAEVRQHPDGSKWAIVANNSIEPQEESNLIFEVQLSDDWTPEEEL